MFKICYLHSIICGPFYPEAVNGLARLPGLLLPSLCEQCQAVAPLLAEKRVDSFQPSVIELLIMHQYCDYLQQAEATLHSQEIPTIYRNSWN